MDTVSIILLAVVAVMALIVFFRLLAAPIKLIFKLLLNALSGFGLLLLANLISGFFDLIIPINAASCLFSGVFGIPGVILLVAFRVFF